MRDDVARNIDRCEHWNTSLGRFVLTGPVVAKSFKDLLLVTNTALVMRMLQIGRPGVAALRAGEVVPAALLARAAVETAAKQHDLLTNLQSLADSGRTVDSSEELYALMFGSRLPSAAFPATNVLTYVDRLSKHVKPLRELYDVLSEFAHPNQFGIWATLASRVDLGGDFGNATFETPGTARDLGLAAASTVLRVALARGVSSTADLAKFVLPAS